MKSDNASNSFLIQVSHREGTCRVRIRDLRRGTVGEYGTLFEVVTLLERLTAPEDGCPEQDPGPQSGPAPR